MSAIQLRSGEYHPVEVVSLADAVSSFLDDYSKGFDWRKDEEARKRALNLPIDNTLAPNNSNRHYWFDISDLYQSLAEGRYEDAIEEITAEDGPISTRVQTLDSLGRDIDTPTYVKSTLQGEN